MATHMYVPDTLSLRIGVACCLEKAMHCLHVMLLHLYFGSALAARRSFVPSTGIPCAGRPHLRISGRRIRSCLLAET